MLLWRVVPSSPVHCNSSRIFRISWSWESRKAEVLILLSWLLLLQLDDVLTQILRGLTIIEELLFHPSTNPDIYLKKLHSQKYHFLIYFYPLWTTRSFLFTTVIHLDFFTITSDFSIRSSLSFCSIIRYTRVVYRQVGVLVFPISMLCFHKSLHNLHDSLYLMLITTP